MTSDLNVFLFKDNVNLKIKGNICMVWNVCMFLTCMLDCSGAQEGFLHPAKWFLSTSGIYDPPEQLFKRLLALLRAISDSTEIRSLNVSPYLPPPQIQCEHRLLWPNEYEWTVSSSVSILRFIKHSYSKNGLISTHVRVWQMAESSHTTAKSNYYLYYKQLIK